MILLILLISYFIQFSQQRNLVYIDSTTYSNEQNNYQNYIEDQKNISSQLRLNFYRDSINNFKYYQTIKYCLESGSYTISHHNQKKRSIPNSFYKKPKKLPHRTSLICTRKNHVLVILSVKIGPQIHQNYDECGEIDMNCAIRFDSILHYCNGKVMCVLPRLLPIERRSENYRLNNYTMNSMKYLNSDRMSLLRRTLQSIVRLKNTIENFKSQNYRTKFPTNSVNKKVVIELLRNKIQDYRKKVIKIIREIKSSKVQSDKRKKGRKNENKCRNLEMHHLFSVMNIYISCIDKKLWQQVENRLLQKQEIVLDAPIVTPSVMLNKSLKVNSQNLMLKNGALADEFIQMKLLPRRFLDIFNIGQNNYQIFPKLTNLTTTKLFHSSTTKTTKMKKNYWQKTTINSSGLLYGLAEIFGNILPRTTTITATSLIKPEKRMKKTSNLPITTTTTNFIPMKTKVNNFKKFSNLHYNYEFHSKLKNNNNNENYIKLTTSTTKVKKLPRKRLDSKKELFTTPLIERADRQTDQLRISLQQTKKVKEKMFLKNSISDLVLILCGIIFTTILLGLLGFIVYHKRYFSCSSSINYLDFTKPKNYLTEKFTNGSFTFIKKNLKKSSLWSSSAECQLSEVRTKSETSNSSSNSTLTKLFNQNLLDNNIRNAIDELNKNQAILTSGTLTDISPCDDHSKIKSKDDNWLIHSINPNKSESMMDTAEKLLNLSKKNQINKYSIFDQNYLLETLKKSNEIDYKKPNSILKKCQSVDAVEDMLLMEIYDRMKTDKNIDIMKPTTITIDENKSSKSKNTLTKLKNSFSLENIFTSKRIDDKQLKVLSKSTSDCSIIDTDSQQQQQQKRASCTYPTISHYRLTTIPIIPYKKPEKNMELNHIRNFNFSPSVSEKLSCFKKRLLSKNSEKKQILPSFYYTDELKDEDVNLVKENNERKLEKHSQLYNYSLKIERKQLTDRYENRLKSRSDNDMDENQRWMKEQSSKEKLNRSIVINVPPPSPSAYHYIDKQMNWNEINKSNENHIEQLSDLTNENVINGEGYQQLPSNIQYQLVMLQHSPLSVITEESFVASTLQQSRATFIDSNINIDSKFVDSLSLPHQLNYSNNIKDDRRRSISEVSDATILVSSDDKLTPSSDYFDDLH
ncbi:hypothetical protein SNEBB_000826 [Seison nebaliae]|nr:hypothetical protein SNEBB_000826 [Seison nebaliae]